MSSRFAAKTFAGLIGLVVTFQIALALGAPWGDFAMGGAFPGVLPPMMRLLAVLQGALLGVLAAVVLSRAGVLLPGWQVAARPLVWVAATLLAVDLVLNVITPSSMERMIWAPIVLILLLTCLRVALTR